MVERRTGMHLISYEPVPRAYYANHEGYGDANLLDACSRRLNTVAYRQPRWFFPLKVWSCRAFQPTPPLPPLRSYPFHLSFSRTMLVINPESSCDICLEHFALDGQSRAPHAPRCGHVFCLRQVDSEPYSARSYWSLPSFIDLDLTLGVSSL